MYNDCGNVRVNTSRQILFSLRADVVRTSVLRDSSDRVGAQGVLDRTRKGQG